MTHRLSNLMIVACTYLLCLAAPGPAAADDYFVNQKHPDATDNNPGTKAKPLMTIQAGFDKAQPSDARPGARRRLPGKRQVQARWVL